VLARLEQEFRDAGKGERFDGLKSSLLVEPDSPGYAELGAQLGLTESVVKQAVHRMRRRYRELFREEIAQTVAGPDDSAIGAKVRGHATINGRSFWQMREVSGGDGSMGQNSLFVHVGLGNATNADLVRIEWPSGTVQELTNVETNQFQTVTEPEPQLTVTRVNGELQLTLKGTQGSRYAIETSTDLTNWTSAGVPFTVSDPSGTVTFPAPGGAPSDPRRFYRARAQ